MKINISLQDDLILKADNFAKKMNITRSGLIAIALNSYFSSVENAPLMTASLKGLNDLINKALKGEEISSKEISDLENKTEILKGQVKFK